MVVVIFSQMTSLPISVLRPGAISISFPTSSLPCISEPPRTPPFKVSGDEPGLLMSKLLATYSRAGFFKSYLGVGMTLSIVSTSLSMLTL